MGELLDVGPGNPTLRIGRCELAHLFMWPDSRQWKELGEQSSVEAGTEEDQGEWRFQDCTFFCSQCGKPAES